MASWSTRPGQEDGELVAAHPGHRVLAADGLDQALADLLDEDVAGGVPVGVVDRLEVVEVDEEHADRLAHPARPDELLLDPVLEQPAVGEAGERVVPRHVGDLLQQLQVLDGGGGLVGQSAQALVEVGVVDGAPGRRPSRSWRRSRPRNSPAANSGATTEAGTPDASISGPQLGVLDGRGVEDHDLVAADHPLDQRVVDLDRQGAGRRPRSRRRRPGPTWICVAERRRRSSRGAMGPRSASGGRHAGRCRRRAPGATGHGPTGRRWTGRTRSRSGTVSARIWRAWARLVSPDSCSLKDSRVRAVESLRRASLRTVKTSRTLAA